jgi:hypothetical protein
MMENRPVPFLSGYLETILPRFIAICCIIQVIVFMHPIGPFEMTPVQMPRQDDAVVACRVLPQVAF